MGFHLRSFPTTQLLRVGLLFGLAASLAQAGSVIALKDNAQTTGKLSLQASAVQVDTGASPENVDFSAILEADFSDAPFQLNFFSSSLSPDQLPPSWKAVDLNNATPPGNFTYAKGVLTISGGGSDFQRAEKEDKFYFAGFPWSGNGQFNAHLREIDPPDGHILAGPMFRESLDALAVDSGMGTFPGPDGNGLYIGRGTTGEHVGWHGFPSQVPNWLRLSWTGNSLDLSLSLDGSAYALVDQGAISSAPTHWFGFFIDSVDAKANGTAVFDQISITPLPAEPGTLPPGVLLSSGSFLAGSMQFLNPDGGALNYGGKQASVKPAQVAAIIAHPITKLQLAALGKQVGIIMKNQDFMESELQGIQGTYFQMNSDLLGPMTYSGDSARAAVLNQVVPVPSEYEVRLKDGSIIQASNLTVTDGQLAMSEVSGLTLSAGADQIAQVRAGTAHVQDLIALTWKTDEPKSASTPPPAAATAAPAPAATPANNVAAVTPAATPDPTSPAVETWQGPNQEQIIVAAPGSKITFPLFGKFSTISVRIALSPDSPPDAKASLRILADGKEAGSTPPMASGAAPALIGATIGDPKTLTFIVDSSSAGARLMIIDPVAIRDTATP